MTIGRWSASRRSPARRGRRLQLEQLEAREVLSTVAVTVDATQVVRAVNDQLLGVNVAWWDSNLNTTKTQQMVQAAGLTMFRMPGGSSSDDFHFNAPPSYNGEGTAPSMASFIASVGGQGLVTLDYGSGSPQEAAAFLAYLNAPVGSTAAIGLGEEWSDSGNTWNNPDWQNAGYWAGLRAAKPLATDDGLNFMRLDRSAPFGFHYFEVGNEEYGSWEIDHHGQAGDPGQPHDPATYAAFAAKFASLAASIDPTIAVGVDAGGVNDYNHWLANVLSQGQSLGFVPNFVSDHSYMQAPGNENDQTLLLHTVSDPTNNNQLDWADRASGYRALLNKTLGTTAAGGVELMATEFNSVYSNPGKQTTSLVNGLFVADSIGSLLETEYDAADVWDLRNGFDTSNNNSSKLYGWRKGGDYGLLGSGGTPPATGTYVAYPTYYAEQLLSQVVHSGDIVVQATSGNTNLAVYGVREATGNLDLLVINKSATAGLTGQFQIVGFQPDTQAHVWQYGKVQDTAQSKTTDGSSALDSFSAKLALSGSSFKYTFPSYSMTVLSLSTTLPAGWSDGDVGGPGLAGYSSVVGTTWTVQGGGADIGNTSDQFNFASRSLIGDGTITARVASLTNTDPSARAGVMLRDSTDSGSAFADVVATYGDGVVFQWRSTDAAQVNQTVVSGVNAPVWVQLVRWGSSFSGYYSADGVNWTQIGTTQTLTMA
ncbi:MAG TPA: hypothetical protein VGX78_02890, partial [Pirellulales bacterium]|nr:hypothetical protein [Pirellulales bacterium]